MFIFFFFFSSRRRHTRLTCDWSSDVCSSNLNDGGRTWRAPVATVDQASGYNVQVVVQPNGAAVLVATQGGNVIASHSTDFGKSWSASVVVSGVHVRQVTGGLRVAGAKPSVRVDGRGTVYAVWSDCR